MDALTALSICDTGLVLLVRAEKQCAVWLHCLVFTTLIIWLSILHIIFGIGVEEEGILEIRHFLVKYYLPTIFHPL